MRRRTTSIPDKESFDVSAIATLTTSHISQVISVEQQTWFK